MEVGETLGKNRELVNERDWEREQGVPVTANTTGPSHARLSCHTGREQDVLATLSASQHVNLLASHPLTLLPSRSHRRAVSLTHFFTLSPLYPLIL